MFERLALPSKEAAPKVVHFELMATDWICENFPKSDESTTCLEFWLLTSTINIFQLEVPATNKGNLKSLANTLFSAFMVIAGFGEPTCQTWTVLSQAVETMAFIPGTKWSELMPAECLPMSPTCPLPTSQTLIDPSRSPTQMWLFWSLQATFRAGTGNLQLTFWKIAGPNCPCSTDMILSSPSQEVEAKRLGACWLAQARLEIVSPNPGMD